MSFPDEVARFLPDLRYYARKFTRSEADAEDLAQDAALRALECQHLYDERGSLWAWLFVMMRRLAMDKTRTDQRKRPGRDEYGRAVARCDTADPEAHAVAADVARAFATLTPEHRRLILLSNQNLSYKQVAAAVGMTRPAMAKQLMRGRDKMRRKLDLIE